MIEIPNRRKPIVTETNERGCELVVSHKSDRFGHIETKVNGVRCKLHRYVYEATFGKIADGLVVRHKCDNPNCVNINHLELGTHADNVADRVERGRSAKGINNGRAKLTEDNVRFIRLDEIHNNSELARMFKVDRRVISDVKNFKTWKHVI